MVGKVRGGGRKAEALWNEIRRAYHAREETLAAIAARTGVSERRILTRARLEGWVGRKELSAIVDIVEAAGLPAAILDVGPLSRGNRALVRRELAGRSARKGPGGGCRDDSKSDRDRDGGSQSDSDDRKRRGGDNGADAAADKDVPLPQLRDAMLRRLLKALERKMHLLDRRMDSGSPMSAAEDERQTKALESIVKSFEKIAAMAEDLDKAAAKKESHGRASAADADRMRQEIAERLERLNRQREAQGRLGEPRG